MVTTYAKDTIFMSKEIKVKELFGQAIEQPIQNRETFLNKACGENKTLYKEVLSLILAYQEAEAFLEKPVANLAAKLVQENVSPSLGKKTEFLKNLIGQTLEGKYLIEKLLGQGGMGAVYLATHLGTDRPVALKIITPEFMANNEFVERFKREAKAAGHLSHPNVVNVTDFGITNLETNKIAYLVMEYLKGITLGQLLEKKGKLPISFTIEIITQVCSAISEAHKQGIIHRDLKPDNIWLEPTGLGNYHVKVLDFGLAKFYNSTNFSSFSSVSSNKALKTNHENIKLLSSTDVSEDITKQIVFDSDSALEKVVNEKTTHKTNVEQTTTTLMQKTFGETKDTFQLKTKVGTVLGTPVYMSPEQCQGKETDFSTDIYSLGIIMYHMLAGSPPFKADSMDEYIHKHSQEPPIVLTQKQSSIPQALSNIVMSTLDKDAKKRPSAQALAITLQTILEGDSSLLGQSLSFYKNNFVKVSNVSFLVNLLFIIPNSFLVAFLLESKFNFGFGYGLDSLWVVFPLISLLITEEINKAALTILVEQTIFSDNKTASTKLVFLKLEQALPTLISTIISSYLLSLSQIWKLILPSFLTYVELSFCPSIAIAEKKKGKKIMSYSKILIKDFYSLASSLKLRSLSLKFVALMLFCIAIFCNINLANNAELSFSSWLLVSFISIAILPGLFLAVSSPIIDIAVVKLYFKAREAQGETINKFNYSEEVEVIEKAKFGFQRKFITALLLIVSIIVSNLSYVLMVPPTTKSIQSVRPKIEKIPDSENAWIEYDLALQDILDISSFGMVSSNSAVTRSLETVVKTRTRQLIQGNEGFANLENVARGYEDFNKAQLDYLDKHSGAIEHLLAGAKRPKAQFYSELPSLASGAPEFLQIRVLTNVACAQAQRLHLQGKHKEAIEIVLAADRMATDIGAEPYASSLAAFTTVVCRGVVLSTLFNLLNSFKTDPETDLEIARQILANQKRLPNTYQLLESELQLVQTTLEDIAINHNLEKLDYLPLDEKNLFSSNNDKDNSSFNIWLMRTFLGLRLRVYNSYIEEQKNSLGTFRGIGLETWNFQSAKNAHSSRKPINEEDSLFNLIANPTNTLNLVFAPDKVIAAKLIKDFNGFASMRSLYSIHVLSTVLEVFAVSSAYKKVKGEFPQNLEQAMNFANLEIPTNFTNNKAVGYRLENNVPVVWLTGLDGVDDGGKVGHQTRDKALSELNPGKDFIFEFGKMPFYFTVPKKTSR